MEDPPYDGLARAASAPMLQLGGQGNGASKFTCKALVLTTPRRQGFDKQPRRRARPQALRPLGSNEGAQESSQGGSAAQSSGIEGSSTAPNGEAPRPASVQGSGSPQAAGSVQSASSSGRLLSSKKRTATAPPRSRGSMGANLSDQDAPGSDSEGIGAVRVETVRLRKQLHRQACEFQETKDELVQTKRELWQVRAEADELRLKLSNLERIDKRKSSELLEERRKNDEMSKQVKEMSANLLSLTVSLDSTSGTSGSEGSGLRKRCFKLVQQNTAFSVQCRLLQRQKGWAEAKARVLQNEVTRVYLGVHDRVKDDTELETVMLREVAARQFPTDEAAIYSLLMPCESVHAEAVVDFVTHITHTHGMDIHGFLHSSRVFSEGIRNDCLSGLAREFYGQWRRNSTLPHILRAVERVVHLSDYLTAFESFSTEITALLGCTHAKIWVVDHLSQCMWSCIRDGDGAKTFTLPLPKGKSPDLRGQGIAVAAYMSQKPVNVGDAREDPRFRQGEEGGPDGHAKSIMCVPVCRVTKAGRQPQVRVVLQAVDKLLEPHFDPDRDGRVLRLLGKVSMEVLQVCESSSASSMNSKRRDALLQLFTEHTPCDNAQTLVSALEKGLTETFLSQAVALHVVTPGGNSTMHISLNKAQHKLSQVMAYGMKGIVGMVAKTMNQNTILASQVESSKYDPSVDLPNTEKTVIHTVPICQGSGCVAVCQFVCPEKEGGKYLGDDGAYHPENTSHFRLLLLLLTFVQKHLAIVSNPINREEAVLPSLPAEEAPLAQDESEEGSRIGSKEKKKGSKVSTDSPEKKKAQKRHATQPAQTATKEELDAAALKIQSIRRGQLERKKKTQKLLGSPNKEYKRPSVAAAAAGDKTPPSTKGATSPDKKR